MSPRTEFPMGCPALRTHVAVELSYRGVAAENERLTEDKKSIFFTDAVDGDSGGKKGFE